MAFDYYGFEKATYKERQPKIPQARPQIKATKNQLITIQGQKEDHHIWLKKAQNRGTTQSHKIRPQKHHLIKEQFKDKHKKDHHTRPQKKATKKAIEKGHKAPK